ncbi:MAG: class I SAM-dependent methyltransferase [Anaerolineales bacterium]|nr:MAG: class I SAM-dependent methyltransferase [Anaerolineales bacterium]
MIRNLLFEWRYLLGHTPWDTGISPPELIEFLDNHPPGRALDLGCGTGTNAITISAYGWHVVGVDASRLAIRRAQQKSLQPVNQVDFHRLDVSRLRGIEASFDLILDIGCFHSLPSKARRRYIERIAQLIDPAGAYLLYTWLADPDEKGTSLPSAKQIELAFSPHFTGIEPHLGTERQRTSAWYQMQARST